MKKHWLINLLINLIILPLLVFAGCDQDIDDLTIRWTFADPISGWTDYETNGNVQNESNANNGNGMTLLGQNRSIRWYPNITCPQGLFSKGAVQPGGAATGGFLRISNVQGPFDITLNYYDSGLGNGGRKPSIIIQGTNTAHGLSTTVENDPITWTYRFASTRNVTVTIGCDAGIRLHDVIITPIK